MSWDDERSSELEAMSDNELDTLTLRIDEQKSLSRKGAERTASKDMSVVDVLCGSAIRKMIATVKAQKFEWKNIQLHLAKIQ